MQSGDIAREFKNRSYEVIINYYHRGDDGGQESFVDGLNEALTDDASNRFDFVPRFFRCCIDSFRGS